MSEIWVFIIAFLLMHSAFGFFLSVIFRRNDIADIMWGLGGVVIGFAGIVFLGLSNWMVVIPIAMVAWGVRLAVHITMRLMRYPREDERYANWRRQWMGKGRTYFYARSYLQVFFFQTTLLFILTLPIFLLGATSVGPLIPVVLIIGMAIWLEGFIFEMIGDRQLTRFMIKKRAGRVPADAVLTSGLWKFSRHPNYWGEVEMWWGLFIASMAWYIPVLWIGILSPLLITYTILKVSGIPMLEKPMEDNPKFQEYKRKTSAFIPWVPKK